MHVEYKIPEGELHQDKVDQGDEESTATADKDAKYGERRGVNTNPTKSDMVPVGNKDNTPITKGDEQPEYKTSNVPKKSKKGNGSSGESHDPDLIKRLRGLNMKELKYLKDHMK